jgi:hypothetical protein
MYEGKDPCPGCGRTGEEVARERRDGLCYDCQQELAIGHSIAKERNLSRNFYKMSDLLIGQMTWYTIPINDIHYALRNLLMTFSQFDRRYATLKGTHSDYQLAGRTEATTARDTFVLPDVTFEAAKILCEKLKDACYQLRRERDSYQEEINEKLREEKNRIYNEGVAYGRNLLSQLNRGEIGVNDFEAFVEKY